MSYGLKSPLSTTVYRVQDTVANVIATASADMVRAKADEIPTGSDNPGLRMQTWNLLIYPTETAPAVLVGDRIAVTGIGTFIVAGVNPYRNTVQVIVWMWVFNVQVSLLLRDPSTGADSVVASAIPCCIETASSVDRGREQNGLLVEPVDAVLRCSPDERIIRGLAFVVTTVNGYAAAGAQARRYEILSVDDLDSMGDTYRCTLAEQA